MNRSATLIRSALLLTSRHAKKAAINHAIRHTAAINVAAVQHNAFHSVCMTRPVYDNVCLSKYTDSQHISHRWFSSAPLEDDINVFYPGLVQRIESGDVQLIDVREPEELVKWGQIANSYNIPLKQVPTAFKMDPLAFQEKYGRSKPLKDATNVVFHCRSGGRSLDALQMARKEGYPIQVKGAFELSDEKFEASYGHPKPSEEDENIVFHCRSGKRSLNALQTARTQGYAKARHYPGGWLEWAKENGLPGE